MSKEKRLISVDLVFENCDFVKIDADNIEFYISDFNEVTFICSNSTTKHEMISDFSAIIEKKANKKYSEFGVGEESDKTIFERITSYSDITWVQFNYDDKSRDEYVIDWGGESDYDNDFQSSEISNDGNLQIKINKRNIHDEQQMQIFGYLRFDDYKGRETLK